jgi:hypothetical protein
MAGPEAALAGIHLGVDELLLEMEFRALVASGTGVFLGEWINNADEGGGGTVRVAIIF